MSRVPDHQHYGNFMRLGRYYVCDGNGPMSGLMSKRAARRFINKDVKYSYGMNIRKCPETPKSRVKIFLSRLKKSG